MPVPRTARRRTTTIDVRSPADARIVGTVPVAEGPEVSVVVDALRTEQRAWEENGLDARLAWVRRYRNWLLDNEARINRLLQAETGKPGGAVGQELAYAVMVLNYYADHAARFLRVQRPRPSGIVTLTKRQALRHRPYPVVGVIGPWNFPLGISLIDAVPALIAGASVVVKPSELTPLAVRAAVAGWEEIGAPPVFVTVTGPGTTGTAVVDAVDFVQFTGSTRTGRAIATRCAEQLKPCGLELGGKDALIVLADADLERAANAAVWGAMANTGQMCTSVERVYVEAAVYAPFLAKIEEKVRRLRIGTDTDSYRFDLGPLATEAQLAIVRRHVDDALAKGATIRAQATAPHAGYHHPALVLADVDHSMLCMTEETFGPLLPVMQVADAEEAVRWANDSVYGLSASVFGRDRERAERIARQLEAGAVNVNDVFTNLSTFPLPQSGWRASGIGARLGGAHGMVKYCRTQALVTSRVNPSTEPTWFPYSARRSRTVSTVARLLNGRGRRRLGPLTRR